MNTLSTVLSPHALAVARSVLAEEEARRAHLVVSLSGAHAYGFPSPDSDLDLKAIHVAPTESFLGFEAPKPSAERVEIVSGVEIDYGSNELAPVLAGLLGGSGNYFERIFGRLVFVESPLLAELRPLARRALSRRVHRHYRGFADNQRRSLERDPTVKKLLYVLRTAATGIHVLETGEIEPDLTRLAGECELDGVDALIERKRAGERTALERDQVEEWSARVDALFARLERAHRESALPETPPNEDELREWLVSVRRRGLST